jgi:serine/threonine protein kinase
MQCSLSTLFMYVYGRSSLSTSSRSWRTPTPCDIKLHNILVFDNGAVKIADFGLAKKVEQKQSTEEKRSEGRGTPLYMSPELVNENEYESPADIITIP